MDIIIEQPNSNLHNLKNKFKCGICSKDFDIEKNLKRHLKLHDPEKKYKCSKCEKTYSRSDHLKRHFISHTEDIEDQKPFRCDFCTKRFSNKSHLNRHIRSIHDENKVFSYKCEMCDLIFNKKRKLNKHVIKDHTINKGDDSGSDLNIESKNIKLFRKYRCYYPFCSRKFYYKGKLNNHVLKFHNQQMVNKTFVQCPFENCFKIYSKKFNLKVHIKTFHYKIEEFVCEVEGCKKTFKHKCSLDRHYEKFHAGINLDCPIRSKIPVELEIGNNIIESKTN